ncbi:MAG: SCO1664 family protein [Thermoflexales bacterium]|nr:SCO1664 family protein [Thermoflexales bacterium]
MYQTPNTGTPDEVEAQGMPLDASVTAGGGAVNCRTPFLNGASIEQVQYLLAEGEIELQGLFQWSSNYTFLVKISEGEMEALAIYKPIKGERPLWDFPEGTLALREMAAYLVSEALGWQLVPPTILREGPHGVGAVQLYVDADPEQHYFTFGASHPGEAQRIALFDAVVNNADRKAGHCLIDAQAHIWAIDHGICFSAEPKLRSVIWDFAGLPIPAALMDELRSLKRRLAGELGRDLAQLLSQAEIRALKRRLKELIERGTFPLPGPERYYPWPLI